MDQIRLLALMTDLAKLCKLHEVSYLQGLFSFHWPDDSLEMRFVLLDEALVRDPESGEEIVFSESELIES